MNNQRDSARDCNSLSQFDIATTRGVTWVGFLSMPPVRHVGGI